MYIPDFPHSEVTLLRDFSGIDGATGKIYDQIITNHVRKNELSDEAAQEIAKTVGDTLIKEHLDIFQTFSSATHGIANIRFPKTRLDSRHRKILEHFEQMKSKLRFQYSAVEWLNKNISPCITFALQNSIEAPDMHNYPRDYASCINNEWFLYSELFQPKEDERTVRLSPLGEGGAVIATGNTAFVNERVYAKSDADISSLSRRGAIVFPLPEVNKKRNAFENVNNHIDGSVALVQGNDNQKYLLCADTYLHQNKRSRLMIQSSARRADVNLVTVNDGELDETIFSQQEASLMKYTDIENFVFKNLPPLPLNLVQLSSGAIIVSGTQAGIRGIEDSLENTLKKLLELKG